MSIQSFSRLAQIYISSCAGEWNLLDERLFEKISDKKLNEAFYCLEVSQPYFVTLLPLGNEWVGVPHNSACFFIPSLLALSSICCYLLARIIRGHILGDIVGSFPDRRIKKRAKDWPPWSQSHRKTDFHFGPPTAPTLCLLVFIPLWPYLFYAWRGKIQN